MNAITKLVSLINNKNWQKFCAAEDWSDPAFRFVLKSIFRKNASYHRKQWEFVTIFLCLAQQGKLHKDSIGASFGAGKEPLIYDLLPFVKSFLATDLYSWTTGWDTARLGEKDTPYDFLKRHAPKSLNIDNLNALEMDMRKLDIEDNSLDFCYSSCAVEHIGHREDFIQHLKEVNRVLKDDGVYIMTTELLFSHSTVANKGNYKFDIEYLRELFLESNMNTVAEFDGRCEESRLNTPRPYVQPLFGSDDLEKLLPVAAILELEGIPYTSCCFILSPNHDKKGTTFEINRIQKSASFISKKVHKNMIALYSKSRVLDPFYSLKKHNRLFLDDHMQFRVDDTKEKPLIELNQPNFCYTNFIWFDSENFEIRIEFQIKKYKGMINWFLIEKKSLDTKDRTKIQSQTIKAIENNLSQVVFKHQAESNKVYAIMGQIKPVIFKKSIPQLAINRINVSARLFKN